MWKYRVFTEHLTFMMALLSIGNLPLKRVLKPESEKTGEHILEILSELHRDGKTFIVVSHDKRLLKYATNVIDMNELLQ